MATLATFFRRPNSPSGDAEFGGLVAVPQRVPTLRALPNEDVYFYSKRIDNSRIVREDNPQARGEFWFIGHRSIIRRLVRLNASVGRALPVPVGCVRASRVPASAW